MRNTFRDTIIFDESVVRKPHEFPCSVYELKRMNEIPEDEPLTKMAQCRIEHCDSPLRYSKNTIFNVYKTAKVDPFIELVHKQGLSENDLDKTCSFTVVKNDEIHGLTFFKKNGNQITFQDVLRLNSITAGKRFAYVVYDKFPEGLQFRIGSSHMTLANSYDLGNIQAAGSVLFNETGTKILEIDDHSGTYNDVPLEQFDLHRRKVIGFWQPAQEPFASKRKEIKVSAVHKSLNMSSDLHLSFEEDLCNKSLDSAHSQDNEALSTQSSFKSV